MNLGGPKSERNNEFSLNDNIIKEEENSLDEDQSDGENKKLEKDIINLVKQSKVQIITNGQQSMDIQLPKRLNLNVENNYKY